MFLEIIATLRTQLTATPAASRPFILKYLDILHRADYAGLSLQHFDVKLTEEDTGYLLSDFQFQRKWLLLLLDSLSELTQDELDKIGPLTPPYTSEAVTEYLKSIKSLQEERGFWHRFKSIAPLSQAALSQKERCQQLNDLSQPISCGTGQLSHQLCYVPSGLFFMGATANDPLAFDSEKPPHSTAITAPFWMGRSAVSQRIYTAVMPHNPSQYQIPDCPVDNVRWIDAIVFCNRLSRIEGLTPVYPLDEATENTLLKSTEDTDAAVTAALRMSPNPNANGYRLPTEAEWEYAAKAQQNTRYAGNADLNTVAWYHDNSAQQSHPCAQKTANAFGLHDMSGNVWEWCWNSWDGDSYAEYQDKLRINTLTPETGTRKMGRGGSWYDSAEHCRLTHRLASPLLSIDPGQGFRVVRTIIGNTHPI